MLRLINELLKEEIGKSSYDGMSMGQIGKKFKLPKSAVQTIINPIIKVCKGSVGRPTIITPKVKKVIKECHRRLSKKNERITSTKIKEITKIKMSKSTICHALHKY